MEKAEEIEQRMPSFVELEKSFALVEEVYEKTKKEVIGKDSITCFVSYFFCTVIDFCLSKANQ